MSSVSSPTLHNSEGDDEVDINNVTKDTTIHRKSAYKLNQQMPHTDKSSATKDKGLSKYSNTIPIMVTAIKLEI